MNSPDILLWAILMFNVIFDQLLIFKKPLTESIITKASNSIWLK